MAPNPYRTISITERRKVRFVCDWAAIGWCLVVGITPILYVLLLGR